MSYQATLSTLNILKIQEKLKKAKEDYKTYTNDINGEQIINNDYITNMQKELEKAWTEDYVMYINTVKDKQHMKTIVVNSISHLEQKNIKGLSTFKANGYNVAVIQLDFININGNNDAKIRTSSIINGEKHDYDLGGVTTMNEWPNFDETKMCKLRPRISWQIIDEETQEFIVIEGKSNPIDRIVVYKAANSKYYLSI
jgi:hypothetical protein